MRLRFGVIPAQAGIHAYIPVGVHPCRRACAGMTEGARIKAIRLPVCVYRFVVIPAKAGIQEDGGAVVNE